MSNLIMMEDSKRDKTTMMVLPEDVPLINEIRAEICDEFIADGKPQPQANWLYAELVRERFRNRVGRKADQKIKRAADAAQEGEANG